VAVVGNESISGKLYVADNISTAGQVQAASMKVGGAVEVYGTINCTGSINADSLSVSGKTVTTLVNDGTIKTHVKSGIASGATGGGESIVYQSPTLPTPPSDETWIYEFTVNCSSGYVNGNTRADWGSVYAKLYNNTTVLYTTTGSTSPYGATQFSPSFSHKITSADVGVKFILKTYNIWGFNEEPRYLVRLTKVKTANLSDAALLI
jgi:hypothetical protein